METLLAYLGDFHYLGLFVALLICGFGVPIPEDIVLITGGYLAHLGKTQLIPTIIIVYFGALCGDMIMYSIGRKFGPDILSHHRLTWFFTPKRIKAINHYFHRYGNHTLFFARFLVGFRSALFLSSGALKIPAKKVLFWDGLAALISIPLITTVAYYLGGELDLLRFWVKKIEHGILLTIGATILFLIFRHWRNKKRVQEEAEFEKESDTLEIPKD